MTPHEFWLGKQLPLSDNVLIQETIDKFGYDPREIYSRSHLHVIIKCEFCLCIHETTMNVINRSSVLACKKCDALASSYTRQKLTSDKHEFYVKWKPTVDFSKIDLEATQKEFGHDPRVCGPFSLKRIVTRCDYCSVPIRMPLSKFTGRECRISCRGCMRLKTVETLQRKYGVTCTLDIPSVQEKLANPKTEQLIEGILQDRYKLQKDVDYFRSYTVGPYSFDFYLPKLDLLIECQGDFFHKYNEFGYSGTPKDRQKSEYVEKYHTHKLVWIYEHELHLGRVCDILDQRIAGVSHPVPDGDLELKPITTQDAHVFLSQYHHLGNLGTIATAFGLHHKDRLVSACVFGGIVRNSVIKTINQSLSTACGPGEMREMRRFCVLPGLNSLSKYVHDYIQAFTEANPKTSILVSYENTIGRYYDYEANGWIKIRDSKPLREYIDPKTNKTLCEGFVRDISDKDMNKFISQSSLKESGKSYKYLFAKKLN